MATTQEIRDAADAVLAARTAFDATQLALEAANDEVVALVEAEQAALDAAQAALDTATEAARTETGWNDASATRLAAATTLGTAIATLADLATQYDRQ